MCAQVKQPQKKPQSSLGTMPVGTLLDRLATDLLGPFPESARCNKDVLAVANYFTKWVEIFAVSEKSVVTFVEVILNDVIA